MASSPPGAAPESPALLVTDAPNDPFTAEPDSTRQRFSTFDSHLFSLGPNASPEQARRALEAHLAETDRRMAEAGKLGTALVQQRKELEDRLKEVEKQHQEGELTEELRQRLVAIEKDYNEVARESARAFLPKPRNPSGDTTTGSPFVPEGRTGRRSMSPSKLDASRFDSLEAQATGSPAKLSVPNRKVRNQPQNRVHDIEFAAEISTSLIAQVRNLQSLLAQKDEELRDVRSEKSKLEYDAEGFQQRLKALDESEGRYKDENWSLETQVHELTAAQRDAADREKKLQQMVNVLQAEKNAAQRELDEVRSSHSRLLEDHAAAMKHHDTELGAAKRHIVIADTERTAMHRRIDDLTGQNQELARAIAAQRNRASDRQEGLGNSDDDFATANDDNTPEHSPPPSPIKGATPRHSLLESETLKTSLSHAQRTIQNLRTNFHREKTEKLELRRMLQDARDELEKSRQDGPPPSRRARKAESRDFKKPPRLLGTPRTVRSEILPADDSNWEDAADASPRSPRSPRQRQRQRISSTSTFRPVLESIEREEYEAANGTSDQAFETANEPGTSTDTEAFHTGAEDFSSDEATETETDSPSKRRAIRARAPSSGMRLNRNSSIRSAASIDSEYGHDLLKTPPQIPSQRYPLRVGRGALRRSRGLSEEPSFQSSPASRAHSSTAGTPLQPGQSLAAELGDFDGSDNESTVSAATTGRRSIRSFRGATASPPPVPPLPKVIMVDSGMMTDSGTDSAAQDIDENLVKIPSPPRSPLIKGFSVSELHANAVEPVEQHDAHAAELEALRAGHANQIEQLHADNAASHTAALEALKANHEDQLSRSMGEAKSAHAQELEALKSGHVDETARSVAEAKDAHARELETLQSAHDEKIAQIEADIQAAHAAELETLRAEESAAHAKDMEALQTVHAEKVAELEARIKAAHASEIEALTVKHSEELATSKRQSDAEHAEEIAALTAAHAAQIELAKKELTDSHSKDLDSLKTSHAAQIEQAQRDSSAAHAQELENLKASHLAQVDEAKSNLAATHEQELEALKAAHATQAEHTKNGSDAAHAAEVAALVAVHTKQLESSQADADATLARELESMKDAHAKELQSSRADADARVTREVDALKSAHSEQLESLKAEGDSRLARELEALKATHAQQLEDSKTESDAVHAAAIAAMQSAHAEQLESSRTESEARLVRELDALKSAHAEQLDEIKKDSEATHAAELAALAASHTKHLASARAEGEDTLAQQLAALKETHAQEIESLRSEHAAAHEKELESFQAAIAKQVDSSKTEGDAAHSQQIEALKAAQAEVVEAHKREAERAQAQIETLKTAHERQVEALKSDHTAAKSREIEALVVEHQQQIVSLEKDSTASKAKEIGELASKHAAELEALRRDLDAAKSQEIEVLVADHAQVVEALKAEHLDSKTKETNELVSRHESQLESLKADHMAGKTKDIQELTADHEQQIEAVKAEATATKLKELEELTVSHQNQIEVLTAELSSVKSKELEEVTASHAQELASIKADHESATTRLLEELAAAHALKLETLGAEYETSKAKELEALRASHTATLETLKAEHEATRTRELEDLKSSHALTLESLGAEHKTTLDSTVESLQAGHAEVIDSLKNDHDAAQSEALETLKVNHAQQLDTLKAENDAALIRAVEAARADHARALEALRAENSAEKDKIRTDHAMELSTLREQLTQRPPLKYSSVSAVQTDPIDGLDNPRTPKRDASIQTSKASAAGIIIAEDETRQSPSSVADAETPESQRPFREMSTNTDARPRKQATPTVDQSAQTALTADSIDQMFRKNSRSVADDAFAASYEEHGTPSTVRQGRSRESGALSAAEPVPARRPGSSASGQGVPPLPLNHREAIEAARTGSSKSSMGPPLKPASAYKNPAVRPHTPRENRPSSSSSARAGTPTPRALMTRSSQGYSQYGHADMHSPTRMHARSRQSSLSSFASEVDMRFKGGDMFADTAGFGGPNTDPRMIQAITQTMIGEYLWKYTRKTGRGEISENRHRRYFWVHPYTRTLYWSDRDPSTAGRHELRAKSVPIEAVRVVTDDNPMPPGLHRKSLIIISPGRSIKFTCTTGQRHETWFNALSYLLLRTGPEGQTDAEEMAGSITQEDVDEFNPQYRRPGTTARPPPSLSSYNSRTTRNESPNIDMMGIPTLTPTHERHNAQKAGGGTFSRLGSRFSSAGIFNSLRARNSTTSGHGIYEASAVHDSAEDLRHIMQQQDQESDRLENVRACCDGKHDVGTLHHTSNKRGRGHTHSHSHTHPRLSATPTPMGTSRSRSRG